MATKTKNLRAGKKLAIVGITVTVHSRSFQLRKVSHVCLVVCSDCGGSQIDTLFCPLQYWSSTLLVPFDPVVWVFKSFSLVLQGWHGISRFVCMTLALLQHNNYSQMRTRTLGRLIPKALGAVIAFLVFVHEIVRHLNQAKAYLLLSPL